MSISETAPNPTIAATALAPAQHIMARSFGEGAIPTEAAIGNWLPGRPLAHPRFGTLTHGAASQQRKPWVKSKLCPWPNCDPWAIMLTGGHLMVVEVGSAFS